MKTQVGDYPENPHSVSVMLEVADDLHWNNDNIEKVRQMIKYRIHWQRVMIDLDLV